MLSLKKHKKMKAPVYNNIIEALGNTPIIKLQGLSKHVGCTVYAKMEGLNPGLSVKDRTVLKMIEKAEKNGQITPGRTTIIEASSGNAGYSLAMICAVKGYDCIVTIKDKSSKEKINMIKAMGAKVVLCPSGVKPDNPASYYQKAKSIAESLEDAFYINQNYNLDNQLAHYTSTGPEIWEQTKGKVTYFISPASTGGTVSGTGIFLKKQNKDIKVIACDSEGSVLKKYHETNEYDKTLKRNTWLEGVGKDIIPPNVEMECIDEFIKVDDIRSVERIINLAKHEGIMAGGSSGATIEALLKIKDELSPNDLVVLIFSDHGSKYLSKFFDVQWQVDNGLETIERVIEK